MAKPFNAGVPGYDDKQAIQAALTTEPDAFAKWWEVEGHILSQQITISMLPQTPEEFMQRVFEAGYVMGYIDG